MTAKQGLGLASEPVGRRPEATAWTSSTPSAARGCPRAVLLAGSINEDELVDALQFGARGIVLKEMASELLIRCIRAVHASGRWLESEFLGRALESILEREGVARPGRLALSAREMEIVRLAATGHHNREIAETLHITEGTVKVHLHNIYEKEAAHRRTGGADALRAGPRLGLIRSPTASFREPHQSLPQPVEP